MPGGTSPLCGGGVGHLASFFSALARVLAYCKLLDTNQHLKLGPCPGHSHRTPLTAPPPKAVCTGVPCFGRPDCNSDCDTAFLCLLLLPSLWSDLLMLWFAFRLLFPIEIDTF